MNSELPLTTAEAAAILRCKPQHVAQLCKTKKIAAVKLGGSRGWRITPTALETFLLGRAPLKAGPTKSKRVAR